MEPVPVAEKLLKTKLFGFSLKRLLQAFGVPLAPGMVLTVLNFPALIFGPAIGVGLIIGGFVYVRTPEGQNPAAWLLGMTEFILGPNRYSWKPIRVQDDPAEIQHGDETVTEPSPEDNQENSSMIGSENTIDNVDFNSVHDEGVIETDESYSLIIEIEARPWLILDHQSREAVYQAYSQFLMGVKSPIQIFTLPVPFDAEEHINNLKEANKNKSENESELIEHGRIQLAQWLENVVELGEIRDRRHFIVVTAQKHKQNEQEGNSGILSRLKPSREKVDQDKRYDELWSRAENVTSALPRTGTKTKILDDREEVLQVLYYYYKGKESPLDMDHGWITQTPEKDRDQDVKPDTFL